LYRLVFGEAKTVELCDVAAGEIVHRRSAIFQRHRSGWARHNFVRALVSSGVGDGNLQNVR